MQRELLYFLSVYASNNSLERDAKNCNNTVFLLSVNTHFVYFSPQQIIILPIEIIYLKEHVYYSFEMYAKTNSNLNTHYTGVDNLNFGLNENRHVESKKNSSTDEN